MTPKVVYRSLHGVRRDCRYLDIFCSASGGDFPPPLDCSTVDGGSTIFGGGAGASDRDKRSSTLSVVGVGTGSKCLIQTGSDQNVRSS